MIVYLLKTYNFWKNNFKTNFFHKKSVQISRDSEINNTDTNYK